MKQIIESTDGETYSVKFVSRYQGENDYVVMLLGKNHTGKEIRITESDTAGFNHWKNKGKEHYVEIVKRYNEIENKEVVVNYGAAPSLFVSTSYDY